MENKFETLTSLLKTRINEHEMLNLSLAEMYQKNANSPTIEIMKKMISESETKIKNIQDEISLVSSPKSSYAEYSSKKQVCGENKGIKTSLYDKIKKIGKPLDDIKPNYDYKEKSTSYVKSSEDDFCNLFCRSNMFLVHFENNSELKNVLEFGVRGVDYNSNDGNELLIKFNDFVIKKDGKKVPVVAFLKTIKNGFMLSIDHLDPTGSLIYRERYHGCKIRKVTKTSLDYAIDDVNLIYVTVEYSDITYETSH